MGSQKVELSRLTLSGLVACLVAALLAVAFLLGRQSALPVAVATPSAPRAVVVPADSARPEVAEPASPSRPIVAAAPPARPRRPAPAAPTVPGQQVTAGLAGAAPAPAARRAPPARPPAAPPAAPPRTEPAPARTQPARPAPPQTGTSGAAPPSAPSSAEAGGQDVSRYLSQIDSVLLGSQNLGDPTAFATQVLQQGMHGDTSGFDQLIASTQQTIDALGEIKPPASCSEHHRLTLGQLRDSLGLLKQVKTATVAMDTSALPALSTQGKSMQADAMRLQELDRKLRAGAAANP